MLPRNEFGFIDLGDNEVISEDDFRARFGSDWSYEALSAHPKATPRWKEIFNEWKAEGILK